MSADSRTYVMSITLVATLGGLLFGYDTAVISGTVSSLKSFFIFPLESNADMAAQAIVSYKWIVSLSALIVLSLMSYFATRLWGLARGLGGAAVFSAITAVVLYRELLAGNESLSEGMLNALHGFVISSALVGCIIGGAIAGYVSERLGRKNGLQLAAVLFWISALGSGLPDVLSLAGDNVLVSFLLYRIIGGVGVGLASMLAPMYIAEIAPSHIRGKLVSWNQFAIILGMLVVYFVNYFIARDQSADWLNTEGWRWMFASEIVPASLFLVFLFVVPKSPRYLVMRGQTDSALTVLKRLGTDEDAHSQLHDIRQSLQQKNAHWLSFGGLLVVIGVLLSVFQQFVGINVVLYYAPEIFRNMGSGADDSLLQTIVVGMVNLSFTVLAILTVDKMGRKPLLIVGAVGMGVSMLGLGASFYFEQLGWFSLVLMLTYTASFAMSWGPVVWVLLSEIFPNSIKGVMAIAVAAQWIANLLVSWTFPMMNDNAWLTDTFHHGFAYWVYGLMGFLAALFVWRWVPETKGRSLEQMEKLWK